MARAQRGDPSLFDLLAGSHRFEVEASGEHWPVIRLVHRCAIWLPRRTALYAGVGWVYTFELSPRRTIDTMTGSKMVL